MGESLIHSAHALTKISVDIVSADRPQRYRPVMLAMAASTMTMVLYPMKGLYATPHEGIEVAESMAGIEAVEQFKLDAHPALGADSWLDSASPLMLESRPELVLDFAPDTFPVSSADASSELLPDAAIAPVDAPDVSAQVPPNAFPQASPDSSLENSPHTSLDLSQNALPDSPEDSSPDASDMSPAFGSRGDHRWYVQGGGATTFNNNFGLVGAGLSHFFANGHSINLELNGMAFEQTGADAVGLNLAAILRWHFVRQPNWSLYVDGGAGILGTTNDVPAEGSSFNFTPQAGGGATIRLDDERRLMVGLRWHHISNANLYDGNPGRDSILGYVGVNFPR